MAKKLNFTTVKEMKTKELFISILWLIGAFILIVIGGMIASKEGAGKGAIGFGLLIAAAGGGWSGYTAYTMIVDPKNAKTCNANYWNKYECVSNPAGTDADYELDITECKAQTNAQYKSYAGVWLKSNSSGNYDAFYIPGDKETVALTADNSSSKGIAYMRKAKANGDNDKGVTATGTGASGVCVTKTLGSMTASSPSAAGLTVKLSGITGFQDSDSITLTVRSTASPPSSASPIVTSAQVSALKSATGHVITGQSMATGSYRITASASGVSDVSTTFNV